MDKDLELFYEYLESPLWTHPITLFISEVYCAYVYGHDFQNGKNDVMNRKFYQKYCTLLGELLAEFSSDYELDAGKVSQLVNISIGQALPVAKHLVASQSYKLFVDLMKSYTIELKMQPSVESAAGLLHSTEKLTKSPSWYDQKCMEKKMEEFAKHRGHSLLMERRLVLQLNKGHTVVEEITRASESSQPAQAKPSVKIAHLGTPGMEMAMAYGFVPYENTVEYKMEKWYKQEKAHMSQETKDNKITPETDHTPQCLASEDCQEISELNQEQTEEPVRKNSKVKMYKSQLFNIPESEEDLSTTKTL